MSKCRTCNFVFEHNEYHKELIKIWPADLTNYNLLVVENGEKIKTAVVCETHWSMKDGQGLGLSAHYQTTHEKSFGN